MDAVNLIALEKLSIFIAYTAGLTSFFSPCLVPLLPSYFTIITGFTFKDLYGLNTANIRKRVFISSIFFVSGFSLVYTILGATGTIIGLLLQKNLNFIIQMTGFFIIFLGLVQIGVLKFKSLEFDYAWNIQKKLANLGYISAMITGIACALIWMPCVGQILGLMLILASQADTALKGMEYLFIFSLGLGTPFLLLGLFFPLVFSFIQRYRKLFYLITKGAGVVLILFGLILVIGKYHYFLNLVSSSIYIIEEFFKKNL
jgi:cytochrome c-type biogenesis protein